jgi:hypothetical protein
MQTLLLIAKILSGAGLLAVFALFANLWRRSEVPAFSYGTVTLSQRRLKWVWFIFVLGALGIGSNRDPVVWTTDDVADPVLAASSDSRTTRSLTLPLPFYRYESERRLVNGAVAEEHVLEGVVLPWPFLWALLSYYVLVVRWNPNSRWARRILEGRRATAVS